MKIEFYDKETGKAVENQTRFVVDSDSEVFADYLGGLEDAPNIGWRIIDQWQPIETAPKDGTWVQLFCKEYNRPFIGKWFAPQGFVSHWCIEGSVTMGIDPSHWMPLPPKPKDKE